VLNDREAAEEGRTYRLETRTRRPSGALRRWRTYSRRHFEGKTEQMRDVLDEIEQWSARGDRIALATVVDTPRSAPRPPGAKMAINDRGEVAGAVSGDWVDGAVGEEARQVFKSGRPKLLRYGIADAWGVGLPCDGELDVFVAALQPVRLQARFNELSRAGGRIHGQVELERG
jgi:xanthine dehydrogenase accessory factor